MNDNLSSLYNGLRKKGYSAEDIGDESTFRERMKDKNNRKQLYDYVSARKDFKIGDYDSYEQRLSGESQNIEPVQPFKPEVKEDSKKRKTLREQVNKSGFQLGNAPAISMTTAEAEQEAMFPGSQTLGQRVKQTVSSGQLDTYLNSDEEKELDKTFKPQTAQKPDDVLQNYQQRFALTARGKELNAELGDIQQEIAEKYANEFLDSDAYKELQSKYTGEQLDVEANKLFENAYQDKIQEDMRPYYDAYQGELYNRYQSRIEDEIKNLTKEQVAGDVDRLTQSVNMQMEEANKRLKKRTPQGSNAMNALMASGKGNITLKGRKDLDELTAAQSLLNESQKIIDEARKKGTTNFFAGLGRGLADTVFNAETWSFGLSDLLKNTSLSNVLDKYDKGEQLSESEQALMDAAVANMATNAYYYSDLGRGYKAGMTTGQSIPFMLEFAINPVSASGSSIAKSILRYGMKKFGKEVAKKGVSKFAARLAGDALAAAGMSATTGAARVAAGTIEREMGTIQLDDTGRGYGGRTGQQTGGEALAKSAMSTLLENQSEMVFNAFKGFGPAVWANVERTVPGGVSAVMDNALLGKAGEIYRKIKSNPTLVEAARRTQFHGLAEEYLEEVYNNFANIPLGEMTLEEATDLDNNIDTFLGLAPTSAAFGLLGIGGYAREQYRHRRKMQDALGQMTRIEREKLSKLEEMSAQKGNEDIKRFIKETIASTELTPEEKKAEIAYAYDIAVNNAMQDISNEQEKEIADNNNAAIMDGQAIYAEHDPVKMRQTVLRREIARERLAAAGMSENDINTLTLGDMNAESRNEFLQMYDENIRNAATDYLNALDRETALNDALDDAHEGEVTEARRRANDITLPNGTVTVVPLGRYATDTAQLGVVVNGIDANGAPTQTNGALMVYPIQTDQAGEPLFSTIDYDNALTMVPESYTDAMVFSPTEAFEGMLSDYSADVAILTGTQIAPQAQFDIMMDDGSIQPVTVMGNNGAGAWIVSTPEGQVLNPIAEEELATRKRNAEIAPIMQEYDAAAQIEQQAKEEVMKTEYPEEVRALQPQPSDDIVVNGRKAKIKEVAPDGLIIDYINDEGDIIGTDQVPVEAFYQYKQSLNEAAAQQAQTQETETEANKTPETKKKDEQPLEFVQDYPRDKNGEPMFSEMSAADTISLLQATLEDDAASYAADKLEEAKKNAEKAAKKSAKKTSFVERAKEIKAIKEERDNAAKELAYWQDIYNRMMPQQEAPQQSQQEAAAAQTKAEQQTNESQQRQTSISTEEPAAPQAAVQQKIDSGAYNKPVYRKKSRYVQDDMALGEANSPQEFILREIATGRITFIWKDTTGGKGLGSHLGVKESEEERRRLIWALNSEEGMIPEVASKAIYQDMPQGLQQRLTQQDVFDYIIEAFSTYGTPKKMFEAAKQMHGATSQEEIEGYDEDMERQYMEWEAEQNNMTVEDWIAYNDIIAEELEKSTASLTDEELNTIFEQIYEQLEQEENERRRIEEESARGTEQPTNNERGDNVLPEQETDTEGRVEEQPGAQQETGTDAQGAGMVSEQNGIEAETEQEKEYSIVPAQYTTKRGKVLDMQLVTFDRELSKDELTAARTLARELKGWYDRDQRGFMMRSEEDAIALVNDVMGQQPSTVSKQIEQARAEVDTNPTEAQKEAGNYKKGHIKLDGYDVTIENPKGSERKGIDASGKAWSVTMNNDYGYIRGTKGVDGDHIDVFLSDNPESGNVYVVDQVNADGTFDEHKVMYGFDSEEEARKAYLANYSPGWSGLGNITEVSKDDFKKWVESSHRKTKAFADYKIAQTTQSQQPKKVSVESIIENLKKKGETKLSENVVQEQPLKPEYGANNKLVTTSRYEELKKKMRDKLNQLNAGFDPELFAIGAEMAAYHIEAGARKFEDYAKRMIMDMGDAIRPYLKSFYDGVRRFPGVDESLLKEMTPYDELDKIDVNSITLNEDEQTEADTEAIASQAETVADNAESRIEEATNEEQVEQAQQDADRQLQEIDKQLEKLDYVDSLHSGMRVILKDGRNVLLSIVMHSGEQIGAAQFSKPRIDRLYASYKGQLIDFTPDEIDIDATISLNQPQEEKPQETETAAPASETPVKREDKSYNGYKVGDKVIYTPSQRSGDATEATIHDFEAYGNHKPVLDTGLAPVLYEIADWSDIKPAGQEKTEKKTSKSGKKAVSSRKQTANLINDLFAPKQEETNLNNEQDGQKRGSEKPDSGMGKEIRPENGTADRPGMDKGSSRSTGTDQNGSRGNAGLPAGESAGSTTAKAAQSGIKNARNNHSERGTDYAPRSPKARFDANVKAIKLMRELMQKEAIPTREQMSVLRKYSGWGGMGTYFNNEDTQENKTLRELLTDEEYDAAVNSINSGYYTPAKVIDAMWDVAEKLGFKGGKILEASAGIGNILGLMPQSISEQSNIEAVEKDLITGNILKLLYPDAKVHIQGFEETTVRNGSVDLAITNVPFETGLNVYDNIDKDLSKKFRNIHDFCIAKNVRKLREGGIGIFISSNGTLDKSTALREWLVNEGASDVIGAFRLNNETFGGTNATSDIIVVRKRIGRNVSPQAIDVLSSTVAKVGTYNTGEKIWDKKTREWVPETKETTMEYNTYFQQHPENMGGEMFFGYEKGDTFRPGSYGLYPVKGKDQDKLLNQWTNTFSPVTDTTVIQAPEETEEKETEEKEGTLFADDKGNFFVSEMGVAVPLPLNKNKVKGYEKTECLNDYKTLKDALDNVLDYQVKNQDDKGLEPLLKALNEAYDNFTGKYGSLNKNTSIAFLRNDVDFPAIAAIEDYREYKNAKEEKVVEITKTDVFNGRVIGFQAEPEPKTVKDGVIASIYKFGHIDLEYIAGKMQQTPDKIKEEILNEKIGFVNPVSGAVEVRYEYLSGNVREKLEQAKANNQNGEYNENIKALEEVLPMDIPAHLIDFSLGSSWIDPKLYIEYIESQFGVSDVKLNHVEGIWNMKVGSGTYNEKNRSAGVYSKEFEETTYGTELVEAALNNRTVVVKKIITHSDKTKETIVDKDATQACAARISEIKDEFKEWMRNKMLQDEELATKVMRTYNDKFNNMVPKTIDEMFLPEHFGGSSEKINLYTHQKRAVIRGTTEPLMLAHEVGSGKTYTLISTAMEMRRLGTAKKPMIVVQNATVAQFVNDAKKVYPNARVLTLTDKDRTPEGRRAFYGRIKYSDWDMIIIPQSTFEMIPDSPERQLTFIQERIDDKQHAIEVMQETGAEEMDIKRLEDELSDLAIEYNELAKELYESKKQGKKKDAKAQEKAKQKVIARAKEQLDRRTDEVQYFDEMGVDAILIDEAHEYKRLGFSTAMTRGVKGIDPAGSKKAAGAYLKTRAVLEQNGWKNVIFATGTPISNTAAEIWTFMKYLMPKDMMKANDIYYFDDFVRNFGNITQSLEFATNGKFKENTRFAAYINKPELIRLWSTVSDTVLTKDISYVNSKIPALEKDKHQDVFLPQSESLISIMNAVREELERFENMSGKEKRRNSHIPLTMYGIAKRAAIDARLVDANAADEPVSKTNKAVEETLRSLKETEEYKGTVAIFCDNQRRWDNGKVGFDLFEDIRSKLVAAGVPDNQIVIIKPGMSITKKQKIFDDVNAGNVRVILGNTQTLGTGVNIHERLHTVIHMDAPDRPMDYTQRNGRILRQGNLHKTWNKPVRILRFGVEDSLDVTSYQRLKTKAAFIDSIMDGKTALANNQENRTLEEEEEGLFDNPVAILSGSQYALLKNAAEREYRKFLNKKNTYEADQIYVTNRLRRNNSLIEQDKQNIAENRTMLEKAQQLWPQGKPETVTVNGRVCKTDEDIAEAFKELVNKPINARIEEIRKDAYFEKETIPVNIKLDNVEATINVLLLRRTEYDYKIKKFRVMTNRVITYDIPALDMQVIPVMGGYAKGALEYMLENVVNGSAFADAIESLERSIKSKQEENKLLEERKGRQFEFSKELDEAKAKVEEYTELMKQELKEKEAKYAGRGNATVNLAEIEGEEEQEGDVRFRIGEDKKLNDGRKITFTRKNPSSTFKALLEWIKKQENITLNDLTIAGTGSKYITFTKNNVVYSIRFSNHTKGYYGEKDNNSSVEIVWNDKSIDSINIDLSENNFGIKELKDLISAIDTINLDNKGEDFFIENKIYPSEVYKDNYIMNILDNHIYNVLSNKKENYLFKLKNEIDKKFPYEKFTASNGISVFHNGIYQPFAKLPIDWKGKTKQPMENAINEYLNSETYNKNQDIYKKRELYINESLKNINEALDKFKNIRYREEDIPKKLRDEIYNTPKETYLYLTDNNVNMELYGMSGKYMKMMPDAKDMGVLRDGQINVEKAKAIYKMMKGILTDMRKEIMETMVPYATDAARKELAYTVYSIDESIAYYKALSQNKDVWREQRPRYRVLEDALTPDRAQMEEYVYTLAEELNLPVKVYTSVNDVPQGAARRALEKGMHVKGWYQNGQINIFLPNATSLNDVKATLLHEGVAHYGLRKMVGDKGFNAFLDKVFAEASKEVRNEILRLAPKYKYNLREATEEYLATMAEQGIENPTFWDKVKQLFRKMLEAVGYRWEVTDKDLRYLLWESYNKLGQSNRPTDVAMETRARVKFGIGQFAREEPQETRFRIGRFEDRPAIIQEYDNILKSGRYNFQEAFQDSMLSVKVLQDLIEKQSGKKARIFEDAYSAENRLSSVNKIDNERYIENYFNPLVEEVKKLAGKYGRQEVEDYIYAKSGLERNEVLVRRDAQKKYDEKKKELDAKLESNEINEDQYEALMGQVADEYDKTVTEGADYSGLEGLAFRDYEDELYDQLDEGAITESEFKAKEKEIKSKYKENAQRIVDELEGKASEAEINQLWDRINAATNETLNKLLESGMISAERHKDLMEMMKYYVPLRGWNEDIAEDVYNYTRKEIPVQKEKGAKGRKSLADNPIAQIALSAQSAIILGNRNKMKQRFFNFIINRPNELAVVGNVWYAHTYNTVHDQVERVYPEINETDDAEAIMEKIDTFEKQMEEWQKEGRAYRGKLPLGVELKFKSGQKPEHMVSLMINGKEYVIYINGNPRAAQALNGKTNAEGEENKFWELYNKLKRLYGGGLTSNNPDFVMANLVRDTIHSATMEYLNKGFLASAHYILNLPKSFNTVRRGVLGKYDTNSKYDVYFKEFITNGGETGYTAIHTIEDYKKEYEKLMNEAKGIKLAVEGGKMAIEKISNVLKTANRIAEDVNRFNAYMSSREAGNSIEESINAAKNITVNFNKKGSLGKGQGLSASIAWFMSKWILFFNPAVQGLYQISQTAAKHSKRVKATLGFIMASGFIMPYINELLIMAFGGSDDDDYFNQTEYTRQNNWLLYTPAGYIKIPLPPFFREIYGLGDILHQTLTGKTTPEKAAVSTMRQLQGAIGFINLIPEGEPSVESAVAGIMPDLISPLMDIALNRDLTGRAIAKTNEFNRHMPEYERVYKGVSPVYIEFSRMLNEIGGDDARRTPLFGNFINPAYMEHLITSYTGGIGKTISNVTGMAIDLSTGNADNIEARTIPVLNRFINPVTDRTVSAAVNRVFYDYQERYESAKFAEKRYKQFVKDGRSEFKKELKEMEKNGESRFIDYFGEKMKTLRKMQDRLRENPKDKKLENEITELKSEMIVQSKKLLE